jgi:hypothetical protein
MQRKPSRTAAFLPQRAQPAMRAQPQPLDPNVFQFVSGGLPKGGWRSADTSSTMLPKGGW